MTWESRTIYPYLPGGGTPIRRPVQGATSKPTPLSAIRSEDGGTVSTNLIGIDLAKGGAIPPVTALSVSDVIPTANQGYADDFVDNLIRSCASSGIGGPTDWPVIIHEGYKLAAAMGLRPLSEMALSKALSRRGIPSRTRGLPPDEPGYPERHGAMVIRRRVVVRHLPEVSTDSAPGIPTSEVRAPLAHPVLVAGAPEHLPVTERAATASLKTGARAILQRGADFFRWRSP